MRSETIARNYAETLLALATKADDANGWSSLITDVANAMESDATLRLFLESPKVSADVKNDVLGKALQDRAPRLFVRYLQILVKNRRQMLIPEIASEYRDLLDDQSGRVHATVTLAKAPSDADRTALTAQLTKAVGRTVVPHVVVNPAILGGLIVRMGDTVMDGSVRRRLAKLRARMVG